MSDCRTNNVSARCCELGTRGCDINHSFSDAVRRLIDVQAELAALREDNERLRDELIRLKSVVGEIDNDLINEVLGSSGGE